MPVHERLATRLVIAILALTAGATVAQADPSKPVRVIAITKENAERSAAAIAAAKNPLIGVPPPGKVIRTEPDWRNARAALPESEADASQQDDRAKTARADDSVAARPFEIPPDRAQVQVIKPGKAGMVVETYIVPRHSRARGL